MKIKAFPFSNVLAVLINLLLVYVLYMISRVAFVLENWNTLSVGWDQLSMGELIAGSLRFDSSAILYTNWLWIILMLLPIHTKERPWWHTMCKWVFVVVNSLGLTINLVDTVYSQFTGRRTTATFFAEFSNEGNLGGIFFTELIGHWYLLLLGIAFIAALWFLYTKPDITHHSSLNTKRLTQYYLATSLGLLVAIPFTIFAMRGGFTRDTRPITISNANQYVHSPQQASIVLNTPFSIIRTIGKHPFKDPQYMPEEQLATIYTPIHVPSPADTVPMVSGQKNVMVIILESFSREYFGYYNQALQQAHPDFVSYTPFLDSLLDHSLTFEHTFANGRKSIDAMPSSLSSVPFFIEPFMAGFFSATSHHPFNIPERYQQTYKGGPLDIHRTIQYCDNALRNFFATASQQPWFKNTIFVFTADHTSQLQYDESITTVGAFSIPIAIYDPSGELPMGRRPGVMQQIDIMPSVLRILGYRQPFPAFGKNVFDPDEQPWAVNFSNDIYQYIEGDYTLLFDGDKPTGLYNYVIDPLQKRNLLNSPAEKQRIDRMLTRLKAIVQTYMIRMTTNHLVIRDGDL